MLKDNDEFQDMVQYWYRELYKLIWAIVWDYANLDRWQLQPDELFAELSAELVKVIHTYSGNGLDHSSIKKLIIVCLRNRCNDLVQMAYNTHRKAEDQMLSLDSDDDGEPGGYVDNIYMAERVGVRLSVFDLVSFEDSLSDDGKKLVGVVLDPGTRASQIFNLFITRKRVAGPKGHWKVEPTPLLLRRSLGWNKCRLDNAWDEVQQALESV